VTEDGTTPGEPPVQEHRDTRAFRGARFRRVDLTGATFRECDVTGVRIVGSEVRDLRVDGFGGTAGSVVVDGVEVTGYVAAELDRRFPERVAVREASTADDLRAAWTVGEQRWRETIEEARRRPDAVLRERVDGEWSFVETVRHLLVVVDTWVSRMLAEADAPFHPLALQPTDYPADRLAEVGADTQADPSLEEVLPALEERWETVRAGLAHLADADLPQVRTAVPAPVWGEESETVRACWGVVLEEHVQHRRFAVRDLAVLDEGFGGAGRG
jgi:uncharacterized damage-inducible protein DinB